MFTAPGSMSPPPAPYANWGGEAFAVGRVDVVVSIAGYALLGPTENSPRRVNHTKGSPHPAGKRRESFPEWPLIE